MKPASHSQASEQKPLAAQPSDDLLTGSNVPLRVAWRQLLRDLFDDEGLDKIFSHVRNMLVGTLVVSAGVFAAESHEGSARNVFDASYVGYMVAGFGVLLVLLNLADGLRRLARRRHHIVLRVTLISIYLFVSIRLAQMLFAFRYTY